MGARKTFAIAFGAILALMLSFSSASSQIALRRGSSSSGGITACSGDINSACSQVTNGSHIGSGTVPNASLVTPPITACSGDLNAGCSQVTSGAHVASGTLPNAALVTAPITACSGDINSGCTQVTNGSH